MPPRFKWEVGLSGLSSRDLSVEARAISSCRGLCNSSQVQVRGGVVWIYLNGFL